MKNDSSLRYQEAVPVPGLTPDEILDLVDLLWLALGCPCDIPS